MRKPTSTCKLHSTAARVSTTAAIPCGHQAPTSSVSQLGIHTSDPPEIFWGLLIFISLILTLWALSQTSLDLLIWKHCCSWRRTRSPLLAGVRRSSPLQFWSTMADRRSSWSWRMSSCYEISLRISESWGGREVNWHKVALSSAPSVLSPEKMARAARGTSLMFHWLGKS